MLTLTPAPTGRRNACSEKHTSPVRSLSFSADAQAHLWELKP